MVFRVIRYDKHKRKDGIKTQVRVVEGYRVDGKIKQKTINGNTANIFSLKTPPILVLLQYL